MSKGFWFEVFLDPDLLTKEEWAQLQALIDKASVEDEDKGKEVSHVPK